MNITRAQGRAALKRMEELARAREHVRFIGSDNRDSLCELGWCDHDYDKESRLFTELNCRLDLNEVLLALAMVVAISGVRT